MTKKFLHITVIGNIASGKSTLTDLLSKKLKAKKIPADKFYKTNPFFLAAVKDRERWSLASDLWFLYQRAKIAQIIPTLLRKNHVVVDSGLPMSYIYAFSRLKSGFYTKDEWMLYKNYFERLSKGVFTPDVIIYLEASTTFLQERISGRNREFEVKNFTNQYLSELEYSLNFYQRSIKKKKINLIRTNAEKNNFKKDKSALYKLMATIEKYVK